MRFRPLAKHLLLIGIAASAASCATSKVVGHNVQLAVQGQPLDGSDFDKAVGQDTHDMEVTLRALKKKIGEAYAVLHTNVQKRWGQKDTKMADKTVYVKYTQGYKSRVITDFDHGSLTVETVDEGSPEDSLRTAIVAALLTSNDPAAVDLFSDKDVALEPNRKPYLFGLVQDEHGKSIGTRQQAQQYAAYLVPAKVLTRQVSGDQGAKTARYVRLTMVKNFETKGAEKYRATVEKYAELYHVSPSLVMAIIRTESNFNPFAVSNAPAYGMMQLVPTSGGRDAYKRVTGMDKVPTSEYLFDPDHSIELGTAYLSVLNEAEFRAVSSQDSRDYCVIAAYNTGALNVTRTFSPDRKTALSSINQMNTPAVYDKLRTSLPYEETKQYVVRVSGYRKQYVPAATTASAPLPASAKSDTH